SPQIENPTILSIMSTQPILQLEGFAAVKGMVIGFQTGAQVFGVDIFSPAVSELRWKGTTCELQPGLIEVGAQPVRTRHPNHHGHRVGYQPETSFAFPQFLQDFLALRNIHLDRSNIRYVPVGVFHASCVEKYFSLLSGLREDDHLLVV